MSATRAPRKTAATVQAEFDRFKQRVVELTMRAKDEHGWCDEVDELLEELGLEPPKRRAKITLTVDLDQLADIAGDAIADEDDAKGVIRRMLAGYYGDESDVEFHSFEMVE